ncbi:glycosyltransferase family 25 protein [Moraxella lacunata]|uniref:Glycosyl transferase family 25 domain-containing protein n=1 Tax=Moraxella lacunata TaxID=477 RepID=A0A1V4H365_MORLA|nr:glycosyltransferase family 25 protein [Moraxella lacunata]OPH39354.1 hypothetical protein B5J94_00825 [Moraxella lacunata]
MLKNYVISLANAQERRLHIIQEFGQKEINFEFFDAVTPDQIDELATKFGLDITNANLTKGELACLFSHVSLWQKAIDDDLEYIGIFEDDVYLANSSQSFLNNTDWIPKDCHIIKIELFDKIILSKGTKISVKDRFLIPLIDIHLGCAGYILSKNAAINLVDFHKDYAKCNGIIAVDHIVFEHYMQHGKYHPYQLNPCLCIQSDRQADQTIILSQLEQDRRNRFENALRIEREKINQNLHKKIWREVKRPFWQFYRWIKKIITYINRKRKTVYLTLD